MDPRHPECLKDCVFTANLENDRITIRPETKEGIESLCIAKKETDWLITERNSVDSKGSQTKAVYNYQRGEGGKLLPVSLERWLTPKGKARQPTPIFRADVESLDLQYSPSKVEFAMESLSVPAGTRLTVFAADGRAIKEEKLRDVSHVKKVEREIEAAVKEATKTGFAAPK
jgi:hypothetical protein